MGIINVTPDSFSDGGDYFLPAHAIKKAIEIKKMGADWIDLGAESSRPGSSPVSPDEEWRRLEPTIKGIKETLPNTFLSIDTYKPSTMIKAAGLGVDMINCIKGVVDLGTLQKILSLNKNMNYIAMHMHGLPSTMQDQPLDTSTNFLEEFCQESTQKLSLAGFKPEQIWLDPGIGFGKSDRLNHSCLEWVARTKYQQIVLGISRKSYIGRMFSIEKAKDRDDVSNAIEYSMTLSNHRIKMVRTHRVDKLAKLRKLGISNK